MFTRGQSEDYVFARKHVSSSSLHMMEESIVYVWA